LEWKVWRQRAARAALPVWAAIYFFAFRAPVVAPLFACAKLGVASLIIFSAIGVWSTVFYFLLLRVGTIDRMRSYLAHLRREEGKGIIARMRLRFAQFRDEPLAPTWWALLVFIVSDAFAGVMAVRLIYPAKFDWRALFLIWAGCALDVLTWTVPVYGLPVAFIASKVIGVLFGSG